MAITGRILIDKELSELPKEAQYQLINLANQFLLVHPDASDDVIVKFLKNRIIGFKAK